MKYRLTFCEADTGILLNEDGRRSINEQRWSPLFKSEIEAIDLKDSLLTNFPNGECMVENLDTGESNKYSDQEKVLTYISERQEYFKYISLPKLIRRFKKEPKLKYYKHNQQVDPIVTTPVDKVEPQSTQGHP